VASAVAAAFLAGEWEPAGMEGRAAAMLGRRPRWLGRLAREAAQRYREQPADRPRQLTGVIERVLLELDTAGLLPRPPGRVPAAIFRPRMGRMRWPVP
jgi:hypothetical protein